MPIDDRYYDRVADAAMTRNLPKYIELARGQADDDKQLTLPMDLPLMERPVR